MTLAILYKRQRRKVLTGTLEMLHNKNFVHTTYALYEEQAGEEEAPSTHTLQLACSHSMSARPNK